MQIIRTLSALRKRLELMRATGGSIALVPTMGALHAGHIALIERAAREADHVIVSIFVNPRQFGAGEDFDQYPRREQEDAALLAQAGVAALWCPGVEEVYPPGFATTISVGALGDRLCGEARPGHFDGVATVVAKLFAQVRPDVALFGEKDWQQLAIIRRVARDLDLGVAIVGMPTVRDADGLALSSRNAYLNAEQRSAAVALPRALQQAATQIHSGESPAIAVDRARVALEKAGFEQIDYVELVDAETLTPLDQVDRPARLLAAARIGTTRLIDNIAIAAK